MKEKTGVHFPAAIRAFGSLAFGMALLIASCANPFEKSGSASSSGGTGSLALSLGEQASSKSIVAGASDFWNAIQAYTVTLTSTSDVSVTFSKSFSSTAGTTAGTISCSMSGIAVGTYTIAVNVYSDTARTTQIGSGSGSSSVTITSGGTASESVALTFTQSASTGGFSLTLQWPKTTGYSYYRAVLDGSTIVQDTSSCTTYDSGNTYYSTTLSKSGLAGGKHILRLYFGSSSSLGLGPFAESLTIWDGVTSTQWVDSSGSLASTLTLSASDFGSNDANLASLVFSTASYLSSFTPGTYIYSYSTSPSGSFTATVTADSAAQSLSYNYNGVEGSWSSISGDVFTTAALTPSGANDLTIIVTAADRQTKSYYSVSSNLLTNPTWASGTVSNDLSTLSISPWTVTLADASNGWTWASITSGPLAGCYGCVGTYTWATISNTEILVTDATEGQVITFSVYTLGDYCNPTLLTMGMDLYDAGGTLVTTVTNGTQGSPVTIALNEVWTQYSVSYTVPGGITIHSVTVSAGRKDTICWGGDYGGWLARPSLVVQ